MIIVFFFCWIHIDFIAEQTNELIVWFGFGWAGARFHEIAIKFDGPAGNELSIGRTQKQNAWMNENEWKKCREQLALAA